jgi:CRP-like cAMP-binding protein
MPKPMQLSMPPMIADLRRSHLFATLSEAQLRVVQESSRTLRLEDGQGLFEAGDQARRFYFVAEGQVKLFRLSAEGDEKIIDIVRTGNTFAEALMFLEHPAYPVSAAAIGPSRVISFDNRRFLDLLRGSVDTCLQIMGTMSQRLRGLIKEIDDLTLQTATTRMCGMLWRQMEHPGSRELELHAPKGALASRLSIKPETFSRILGNLSAQGVIRVRGARVEILDPGALTELAHPETLVGLGD